MTHTFPTHILSSENTGYRVYLVDGRGLVASLPADAAGPATSYIANGRSWHVVTHSARHEEGPGRYAWIVHVQRQPATADAA